MSEYVIYFLTYQIECDQDSEDLDLSLVPVFADGGDSVDRNDYDKPMESTQGNPFAEVGVRFFYPYLVFFIILLYVLLNFSSLGSKRSESS